MVHAPTDEISDVRDAHLALPTDGDVEQALRHVDDGARSYDSKTTGRLTGMRALLLAAPKIFLGDITSSFWGQVVCICFLCFRASSSEYSQDVLERRHSECSQDGRSERFACYRRPSDDTIRSPAHTCPIRQSTRLIRLQLPSLAILHGG